MSERIHVEAIQTASGELFEAADAKAMREAIDEAELKVESLATLQRVSSSFKRDKAGRVLASLALVLELPYDVAVRHELVELETADVMLVRLVPAQHRLALRDGDQGQLELEQPEAAAASDG